MNGYRSLHSHRARLMPAGAPTHTEEERQALAALLRQKQRLRVNIACAWAKAHQFPDNSESRRMWEAEVERLAVELEGLLQ